MWAGVARVTGTAEDDDRDRPESGMVFELGEDVEAGQAGHVEVEQDHVGERGVGSVEEGQGALAIGAGVDDDGLLVAGEGLAGQFAVGGGVIDQQHPEGSSHGERADSGDGVGHFLSLAWK